MGEIVPFQRTRRRTAPVDYAALSAYLQRRDLALAMVGAAALNLPNVETMRRILGPAIYDGVERINRSREAPGNA
jgi:hypothetical protein